MIERIEDHACAAAMLMEDALPALLQTSRTTADTAAKANLLHRLIREIAELAEVATSTN